MHGDTKTYIGGGLRSRAAPTLRPDSGNSAARERDSGRSHLISVVSSLFPVGKPPKLLSYKSILKTPLFAKTNWYPEPLDRQLLTVLSRILPFAKNLAIFSFCLSNSAKMDNVYKANT